MKSYNFALILYPDSEIYNYLEVLEYIEHNFEKYAYIVHDPEVDGEKLHIHVILKFPNKRYISAISKELGVPENYIQKCNLKPYLRYLVHFDDEDKKQYSIDDVKGTMRQELVKALDNEKNEDIGITDIFYYITNYEKYLTMSNLFVYVIDNGLFSVYRRYYSVIKDMVIEHNATIQI